MDECRHRIRAAREGLGLSQEDLARSLSLSVRSIGRFESGDSNPSIDTLQRVAEALQVSPAWLLTGEGRGPAEAPAEVA